MRTAILTLALIALAGCNRPGTTTHRDTDVQARKAGRDAYQATQDLKHDAKKAAAQIRDAGKEFRQGWEEQKHADKDRPSDNHTAKNRPER